MDKLFEKRIIAEGKSPHRYKVYDDNSIVAKCIKCGRPESRPSEVGVKLLQADN